LGQDPKAYLSFVLKPYIAVETEEIARKPERYFKSGSGKVLAKKRLWHAASL
jgi:hypothetical protein